MAVLNVLTKAPPGIIFHAIPDGIGRRPVRGRSGATTGFPQGFPADSARASRDRAGIHVVCPTHVVSPTHARRERQRAPGRGRKIFDLLKMACYLLVPGFNKLSAVNPSGLIRQQLIKLIKT